MRRDALPPGMIPLMVDKATAAGLCSMSVATYDKYAKRNLLPPMNLAGRISVAALRQAVLKLDGLLEREGTADPNAALAEWESKNGGL